MVLMFAAMVGCQKDGDLLGAQSNANQVFYASFDNGADTRTALDSANDVLWSVADQISVFAGHAGNQSYILQDGAGSKSATFEVNGADVPMGAALATNVAYYPYDGDVTVSENAGSYTFAATFPATQTYSESGTFGNGASPMVAVTANVSDNHLKFKNVGACFRLQLKGNTTITKIVFSANTALSGDYEVTASNTDVPTVNVTDGSNTITLDCGDGVALNMDTATNFVVAVLPVTIAEGGIMITIYDSEGKKMVGQYKSDSAITFERSKAYSTEELIYSGDQEVSADDVQTLLDNATSGTTIQLEPEVNYGTLYLRQKTDKKNVDITDIGGDATNNEWYSKYENITIIGAPGAVVDQIAFDVGWLGNSEGASYVDVKNLTVKDVTFSGEATAFNMDSSKGSWLGIDGLTIDNCSMTMNDADVQHRFVFQQISGYKQLKDKTTNEDVMTTGVKNLKIQNCTVTNAYQVIESRAMENLTITNNTFTGIKARDMLITVDKTHHPDADYSGTITITDNTSMGGTERFIRANGTGDATLTITNNTINDYKGADYDYIKVTDYTGTLTIENNTCSYTVDTAEKLQNALDCIIGKTTINLTPNVNYDVVYMGRPTDSNTTTMYCETNNYTTTDASAFKAHLADGAYHATPRYTTTLKNLTINGATGATIEGLVATSGHMYGDVYDYVLDKDYDSGSGYYNTLNMENVVFSNVNFTGKIDINTSDATSVYDGVTFDGCTFTTGGTASANGAAIRYYNEANNGNVKNIVVKGCEFTNCYQGVYVHHVNGVTVTGSEFDATGHNAIAIQSADSPVNLKNVVITGNTFKNIGDRIIRFNKVAADSNITIQGNISTNSGDDDGEVMKATSIESGVTTSISGNNWNNGEGVVANDELKDK